MNMTRLTAAQATVRYPRQPARERCNSDCAVLRWCMGDLWSRQCCRSWRGASRRARCVAHPSRSQRAGHGPRRDCVCQADAPASRDGVHYLDRPRGYNLVTAAALAHVNRLPVLLLPGDVYASRRPAPVLQQVEDFADGTLSANDCLKAVSRYFDRVSRPEQLLDALPRALATLLDPVSCGPVTLAFCQDVQAEAFDFPTSLFAPRLWYIRAPRPDPGELDQLANLLRKAKAPLIIAGGGVSYARAGTEAALAEFALRTGVPVAETRRGRDPCPGIIL